MKRSKANSAAIDGIILALVTIVISCFTGIINTPILSILLWVIQLIATIWTLLFLTKRWSAAHAVQEGETTYNQAFSYGFLTSLFSAIILAVFSFIYARFLFPDTYATIIETYQTQLSSTPGIDAQTMRAVERVFENIAVVSTIAKLIWCTILGLIFSTIIASSAKVTRGGGDPDIQ